MESRLGRYTVLKHLASGGMADVLLGRTDGIEGFVRHVVLKRIRPDYAKDQRFIRMFLDEARVAASLHHQHIVQVHDVGEAAGEYFIAMEYIHGEDVRTLLSNASKTRAHVPLGNAIAIVAAAAAGLHYAHERRGPDKQPLGIVHRDVSPSNILVGYDGSVKVVDFGIAKASSRTETRSGHLKGKTSYMSPEQCRTGEVDRRSDVYSLGVVLYEIVTTTRLFKGDNEYRVMDAIVHGRVTLPQVRRPDVPNELSAIIMRALSPDPERRYFTADELRVALEQFAAKAGMTASTSSIAAYMRKQFGERPEPWLDLQGEFEDSFGSPAGSSASSSGWTELPRSDVQFRSSSMIPQQTEPIGRTGPAASASSSALSARPPVASRPTMPELGNLQVGRESAPPAGPAQRFTPAKLALFTAPLVLILGVAIWRLAANDTPSAPAVAAAPSAPAQAPASSVAPIDPPRPAAAAIAPVPAAAPAAVAVQPEPAAPRPRATSKRAGSAKLVEPAGTRGSAGSAAPAAAKTVSAPVAEVASQGSAVAQGSAAAPTPAPAAAQASVVAQAPAGAGPGSAAAQGSAAPAIAAQVPVRAAAKPATVASAPAAPQNVAPTALDANRIGGDKNILPDESTKSEMSRAGVNRVIGSYKVCITADGSIGAVTQIKTTGFAAYDARIQQTIRNKWRYRPFMVNGKPAPVCTAVRFVYSQK